MPDPLLGEAHTLASDELGANTVSHDAASGAPPLNLRRAALLEEILGEGSETPVARDVDKLPARELELGLAESLARNILTLEGGTDRDHDLVDLDTGAETVGLPISTTHTGLQTIRTGAGKHLVDTDDVEGVKAHADVEVVLADATDHVLVGSDTGSLKRLGRDLLLLEGDCE